MITCFVRYEIDPARIDAFETCAGMWCRIVTRLGGAHLGCFLPHEGASDIAICLFSFRSLADYECYRDACRHDAGALAAVEFGRTSGCIRR